MAGLLSFASMLSGFNGGKSQVQSWFLGEGADFPFLNLLKQGTFWTFNNNQGGPTPSQLNPDGYPTDLTGSGGGLKCLAPIFPPSARSGTYVLTWSGNGTLSLGVQTGGSTITAASGFTSANLTSTTGAGRYEFTTTDPTGISILVAALGSPVITDLQFFLKADETALNAGQVFGTQFLAILRSGNPGVLRFLNWASNTTTNLTTWASRKPTTYYSYGVSEYRASIYTGSTTVNRLKFAASLGSLALVDKQTVLTQLINTSVSISIGANSQVSWVGHNLQVGNPFMFIAASGVTLPTGISSSSYNGGRNIYWVTNVIDANTFNFSATKGGANLTTSGSQVGQPLAFACLATQSVTITANNPGVVNWSNHGLSIGEAFQLGTNGVWPSGQWGNRPFYVSANNFTTSSFQFSLTPGGSDFSLVGATGTWTAGAMATFNLNGTGDVPILAPYGDTTIDLFADPRFLPSISLTYDSDLTGWMGFGGGSSGQSGLNNAFPPEIMMSLCTAIGAHPHINVPYMAVDPMTDWTFQMATYVKNNCPTWMKPRFEGPNETWNPSLGFNPTRYAWNKAPAHWGSAFWQKQDDWYGKVMSTVGQDVNAVYGGTPGTQTNYAVICAIQTVSAGVNNVGTSSNDPRLASTQYVAQAAAPQAGYVKNAAFNWVTHSCIANYWNPGERDTATEMVDAYNYSVTNSGNPTAQNTIADAYLNTANTGVDFQASISNGSGGAGTLMVVTAINYGVANGLLPGCSCNNLPNFSNVIVSQVTPLLGGETMGGVGRYNMATSQNFTSQQYFTFGAVSGASASFGELVSVKRYALFCKAWAAGFGVTKLCAYEGGYSPDYPTADNSFSSTLTGITQDATGAVVTLAAYHPSGTGSGAAVVGMPILISGVSGMTQINNSASATVTFTAGTPGQVNYTAHGFSSGQAVFFEPNNTFTSRLPTGLVFGQAYYVINTTTNTFTVSASTGGTEIVMTGASANGVTCKACWVVVSIPGGGTTVKLNVDSSGFGTYGSGGTVIYGPSLYLITMLRQAGKFRPLVGTYLTQQYNDYVAAGGEFPSCYVIGGTGTVWTVWDPTIYNSTTPPQWAAITAFNT